MASDHHRPTSEEQVGGPEDPGTRRTRNGERSLERAERDRDRALDAQARFAFLARSSRILAESLDYEETLKTVAAMALPHLGGWCIVDIVAGGELRRLAVIHPDPAKQAVARELHERYPPESDDVLGVRRVIESGESEVVLEIPESYLRSAARDAEHLRLLRELGIGGYMTAPLSARGQVLGAVTFVTAENGRVFGDSDLLLAEDLARRGALAIDNARLFEESQEANRAKMDFLSVISHELRTPMTSILGCAELIESGVGGPINETQKEHMNRIRSGTNHLIRLVDELLDYARLEAGRSDLRWELVPVAEIVQGALDIVRRDAEEQGLELGGDVPADLTVETDRRKLHYVLVNLLGNAIKFTREGAVRVRAEGQADSVLLEVEDTGIGLSAEQQKRIFEPFWQAESATTRTRGGRGIGLSLAKRLVEALGGEISVESELGQGAVFRVRLPMRWNGGGRHGTGG